MQQNTRLNAKCALDRSLLIGLRKLIYYNLYAEFNPIFLHKNIIQKLYVSKEVWASFDTKVFESISISINH